MKRMFLHHVPGAGTSPLSKEAMSRQVNGAFKYIPKVTSEKAKHAVLSPRDRE